MVADPPALENVTAPIAAGVSAPTTVVQMSTVGPDAVSRFAAALPTGVEALDAPVLGSLPEAEAGTLEIFAGGPAELVERWTPLLSALGSVHHVGPLGAGSAAKLVANSTLFGVLGVLGEALALADGLGLSREAAYEVLAATPLAAQAERRRPAVESGDYPLRFTLSLAVKDANLIHNAAAAELRLAEAARSWLADAAKGGFGARDYSAVLAWILGSR
jgi:3-hydroxyisobutyrate dehydrogenase/2-hydroxy-3-oxopropionate reductase